MHSHYYPYVVNEIAEIEISYKPYYNASERITVNSIFDAFEIFRHYRDRSMINFCEMCYVVFLNNSSEVIGINEFTKGTDSKTACSVKQLVGIALKVNASGIVLAHNHTSKSTTPSSSDHMVTVELEKALNYFRIKLIDHLVINPEGEYYSFRKEGEL